jgi:Ca2+-binding RTX toxin-like protein
MKPPLRSPARAALPALALAVLLGVAVTATNLVPSSRAGRKTETITVNDLKPASCSALTLADITTGSGVFNDDGGSNLVLGGSGVDTIRGMAGNDCILGGGAIDSLRGDGGTDVCIGGPGTDSFHSSCETQIQ